MHKGDKGASGGQEPSGSKSGSVLQNDGTSKGPVRPIVLPDTFTGKEEEFIDWLESFEACAAVNKWTDEEKCQFVAIKLKGSARKVFNNIEPRAKREREDELKRRLDGTRRPDLIGGGGFESLDCGGCSLLCSGLVERITTDMLVDTGFVYTLINKRLWDEICATGRSTPLGNRLVTFSESVISANGEIIHILGEVRLTFQLGYADIVHRVLVAPDLAQSCILVLDFLGKSKAVIDIHSRKLMIDGKTIPL
ncbi:hypothetical protein LOTGIDRAFT_136226, partial [Lottia gigantea]